ncbi:TonB family protein [Limibaculum sp. M0105]|uniref:TonB family protein n=1 Tax=Thermohalobaculum xanthum TaxID=2753746 RepID=A0A8J7M5M0_9RHOB|nr:energy transducer TonB [Thermohalobaculum xanthum]MBK0398242.1 TonB family protein [Thermohalobaculum xanthum]
MRRAEGPLFLILAVLVHLALLGIALHPDAPEAGGGGGIRSITAAPAEVMALVEAWEVQPEPAAQPPELIASSDPKSLAPRVHSAMSAPGTARRPEPPPLAVARLSPLGVLPTPTQAPSMAEHPERSEIVTAPAEPVAKPASERAAGPVTAAIPGPKPDLPSEILPHRPARGEPADDAPPKPSTEARKPPEAAKPNARSAPSEHATEGSDPISAVANAAAGSTGNGSAGSGSTGTAGGGGAADAKLSLGAAVRAAIEREKSYPRRARLRRIEGMLALRVTISRNGGLIGADIARSSGQALLDEAALDAARTVDRYPSAPVELPGAEFSFVIPVAFQLR